MLKIGQLAHHAGLTVRTLHHYDSIALLRPSVRSDAGYRLYSRDDVARLQQIQALRQLGMPLADIGTFLAQPGSPALAIVERQLAALDRQLSEAARMRAQLRQLHAQLSRGEEPAMADWLSTLEQMKMYEHYFSKEELARIPLYHDDAVQAEWRELVAHVSELMQRNIPPDHPDAREAGLKWMNMLDRDTGGNPSVLARLNIMHDREPALQAKSGITPAMKGYIAAAMGEIKLAIYAKYLQPDELEKMRHHQRTRSREWPSLIESVSQQMAADPAAATPEAKILAGRWMALFHDMVGNRPDTIPRFRAAVENEPLLRIGRGMNDAMLAWLRGALHRG